MKKLLFTLSVAALALGALIYKRRERDPEGIVDANVNPTGIVDVNDSAA